MAEITVKFKKAPVDKYVVELDVDEAQAIVNVGYKVGGSPAGLRGAFDRVYNALQEQGLRVQENSISGNGLNLSGVQTVK